MAHEVYGLLAEFSTPEALTEAVRRSRRDGLRSLRAFTPYPVEDVEEALELPKSRVPPIMFAGGVLGGLTGYGLQYFATVWSYPWNVGGRPFHSWPLYIPVFFETTVLGSALFGFVGMLALNGLPKPYHPVFNVPQFARASREAFFLCVEAKDPHFDIHGTSYFLENCGAQAIYEVPK